jgi:hypothetical protein
MSQELIQAEVRLYFLGRQDWDTEFFQATSATDVRNKAAAIAKLKRADHSNCGRATAEDEYKHSGPSRKPRVLLAGDVKDQVAAIESFTGIDRKKSREVL